MNPDARNERIAILSGAFFLFGLAALITWGLVWPGIMALIVLSALPILVSEEGWAMALWLTGHMAIWLGGIPLLIGMDAIWPGILVLAGLSTVLVALAPPDRLQAQHKTHQQKRKLEARQKAKRGLPLPSAGDWTGDDESDWIGGEETDPDDVEYEEAGRRHAQHR